MKRSVWVLALAMSGCASVSDINQTPPTMSVISGKKPHEYAKCVSDKLAKKPWSAASGATQEWRSIDRPGQTVDPAGGGVRH
nr:hypothetical protein GCM10020185_67180 [Pseudomonas brassicacearum subsp. brassicacearum]